MKTQKTLNSQNNLEKEWSQRNHCPDFTLSYKATVMKRYGTSTKIYTFINERMENTEINPCTYGQLICDKGGRNIQWGKYSFPLSRDGKMGQVHVEE